MRLLMFGWSSDVHQTHFPAEETEINTDPDHWAALLTFQHHFTIITDQSGLYLKHWRFYTERFTVLLNPYQGELVCVVVLKHQMTEIKNNISLQSRDQHVLWLCEKEQIWLIINWVCVPWWERHRDTKLTLCMCWNVPEHWDSELMSAIQLREKINCFSLYKPEKRETADRLYWRIILHWCSIIYQSQFVSYVSSGNITTQDHFIIWHSEDLTHDWLL